MQFFINGIEQAVFDNAIAIAPCEQKFRDLVSRGQGNTSSLLGGKPAISLASSIDYPITRGVVSLQAFAYVEILAQFCP